MEILEKSGPDIKLNQSNLIMEVARDLDSIKWFAKRLARQGQPYTITVDRDFVFKDEDSREKSAVYYRLYSDTKVFTGVIR